MSGLGGELKRKASPEGKSISPPPLRRKIQSTTTQDAVSSFFKPSSQKPPEKVSWQERAPNDDTPATLLVGKYVPSGVISPQSIAPFTIPRRKIAAFDFDSTLIQTSSGKKHGSDAGDWKWWHPSVPEVLKKLYSEEGYLVVIISNQAGIALKSNPKAPSAHRARLSAFKGKATSVLTQLDFPMSIYAATEKDIYRKPRTGIWQELLEDNDLSGPSSIDKEDSFFVGDAGGRLHGGGFVKDFSSSDRDFAHNVGIKFLTPEEYFLKQNPREFRRLFEPATYIKEGDPAKDGESPFSKTNPQDIVLFVGSPGAGKSTFYQKYLKPHDYVRINQDTLKTRDRCLKVAAERLSEGQSVAIDNTNAEPEVRSQWVALAAKHNIPIRCILFLTEPEVCKHNDAVRAMNISMNPENRTLLPTPAFSSFQTRYRKPELSEGFQDITEVKFQFQGSEAERTIWNRYWT